MREEEKQSVSASELMPIQQLRLRVAVNTFKLCLLDKRHVPGKSQTSDVFNALATVDTQHAFSERTWESWFGDRPVAIQARTAKVLDAFVSEWTDGLGLAGSRRGSFREGFFEQLIRGGLVSRMLRPTKSKHVRHVLTNRAQEYVPISALHLHLDAIEVNTIADGFCGIPWHDVKATAAHRVLELLSDWWNPRHGSIYSRLSSSLKLKWDAADANQREHLKAFCARFKPGSFEEALAAPATPNWDRLGVERDAAPQHIYKTLFAMAADPDFLVEDRLTAWALDLATSALAMYALAWSDRYTTFDPRFISDEVVFWGAFDHVLFGNDAFDDRYFLSAMGRCPAKWGECFRDVFKKARETYQDLLYEYHVLPTDIALMVEEAASTHPLEYRV